MQRTWDRTAQMRAVSVIDTVGTNMMLAEAQDGEDLLIPIGGMAHAGSRGVSSVEVQVDGSDWQQAELRTPISELTWVLWRFDWPFTPGKHTFTVRCTDGNGDVQISERRPPHPSGATGLHREQVTL